MEFMLPAVPALRLIGLGTLVLGVLIIFGIFYGRRHPANYVVGSVICIALGIFLLTLKSVGSITISNDELILKAALSKTQVIRASDIRKIWIEDLAGSAWRPGRRQSGTAIGKLRTGRFTLHNGRKAFLVLQGKRALILETDKEAVYLIGVEDFTDLLDAVRSLWPEMAGLL